MTIRPYAAQPAAGRSGRPQDIHRPQLPRERLETPLRASETGSRAIPKDSSPPHGASRAAWPLTVTILGLFTVLTVAAARASDGHEHCAVPVPASTTTLTTWATFEAGPRMIPTTKAAKTASTTLPTVPPQP